MTRRKQKSTFAAIIEAAAIMVFGCPGALLLIAGATP